MTRPRRTTPADAFSEEQPSSSLPSEISSYQEESPHNHHDLDVTKNFHAALVHKQEPSTTRSGKDKISAKATPRRRRLAMLVDEEEARAEGKSPTPS
jgi:hypothetical protein